MVGLLVLRQRSRRKGWTWGRVHDDAKGVEEKKMMKKRESAAHRVGMQLGFFWGMGERKMVIYKSRGEVGFRASLFFCWASIK